MGTAQPVKTHLNIFSKCAPGTTLVLLDMSEQQSQFSVKKIKLRIESETRKIETLNLRARGSGFIILCASFFSQDEEFEKPEPYSHKRSLKKLFYRRRHQSKLKTKVE